MLKVCLLTATSKKKYTLIAPCFKNFEFFNYVFNFKNAINGLKQTLLISYDNLKKIIFENNFERDKVDTLLFIKKKV